MRRWTVLGLVVLLPVVGAACKDTAEPDANNPSLEGVQDNPSRVTVSCSVRSSSNCPVHLASSSLTLT